MELNSVYQMKLHLGVKKTADVSVRVVWVRDENIGCVIQVKNKDWDEYVEFCLQQLQIISGQLPSDKQNNKAAA